MIQAIMDGEFKLLYEQLIYTNRGEQILESKYIPNLTQLIGRALIVFSCLGTS